MPSRTFRLAGPGPGIGSRVGPPIAGAEDESAAHGQGGAGPSGQGADWAPAYGLGVERSGPFVQGRDLQTKYVQDRAMGPTKGISYGGPTRNDDYSAPDWQDNRARQSTHERTQSGPHYGPMLPTHELWARPVAHASRATRDPSTYRYERDPSGWYGKSPTMTGRHWSFAGILAGRAQMVAQSGASAQVSREIINYEDPGAGLDSTEFAPGPAITVTAYAGSSRRPYRLNG